MARKGLRCLVDAAPLRMQIRTVMSLVRLQEIESLTAFRRETSRHLKELARTGRPKLLTINGRAALVVQDAAAFETMMERLETLAGVARGTVFTSVPSPQTMKWSKRLNQRPSGTTGSLSIHAASVTSSLTGIWRSMMRARR